MLKCSVVEPHHFDEVPDADADAFPDSTYHPDADPDPHPSFQIKAQNLEKVLKYAHFPYILACHQQIADPDPDYHFDAAPDPDFVGSRSGFLYDADLDPNADPVYQNDADLCGSGCGS
jgi:hypothetical protein